MQELVDLPKWHQGTVKKQHCDRENPRITTSRLQGPSGRVILDCGASNSVNKSS